ncbi:hypothetical protein [Streptomyces erythrochromogenes]|uniref:hypothetical protein n=1 Tax=Streptomyces erythrochromogenes TaxID=285574 RepID=UPI00367FAE0C
MADYEEVELGTGGKLILPYAPMPATVKFNGMPGDAFPTDWNAKNRSVGPQHDVGQFGIKTDVPFDEIRKEFPDISARESQLVFLGGNDASTASKVGFDGIQDFLSHHGADRAAFFGWLYQKAPVMVQSDWVQGPQKMTFSTLVTETTMRTETSGWSVGGTVKASLTGGGDGAKPTGEVTGTFTYSRMVADTYSFAKTQGSSYERTIPEGKWGFEEVRFAGGVYDGYLVVRYAPEELKFFIGSMTGWSKQKYFTDKKIPVKQVSGFGTSAVWANSGPVFDIFQIRVGVKVPGNLPAVTRNVVLTEDRNKGFYYYEDDGILSVAPDAEVETDSAEYF